MDTQVLISQGAMHISRRWIYEYIYLYGLKYIRYFLNTFTCLMPSTSMHATIRFINALIQTVTVNIM